MSDAIAVHMRFSIVIPAYSAATTLSETLDAVLAQRFADWECIVVDDGSKDDTAAVAQAYAAGDARVRVVSQANQGTGGAYNAGVAAAAGEFIVVCSADDLLLPDHLTEVSARIDAGGACDIYSTNGFLLSPDGSTQLMYGPEDIAGSLNLAQVVHACFYSVGAVYKRGVFDLVGGYRVGVFGEDYDFWLRAMSMGAKHCYIPKPLSMHRLSSTQKSSDLQAALRSDVGILRDLARSGRLSWHERKASADSACARLAHLAHMDSVHWRGAVRLALVYLSHPGSLVRGIGRRLRRASGSSAAS